MVRPAAPLSAQADQRDAARAQEVAAKASSAETEKQRKIDAWIAKIDAEIAEKSKYGRYLATEVGHVDASTAGWYGHIAHSKVPEVLGWYLVPLIADLRANGYQVKARVQESPKDYDEPGAHTGYDMILEITW